MNEKNCIPYVELKTSKGSLKLLVDTGSNKSYLNPSLAKSFRTGKLSQVQTVNGIHKVDKYIKFNPFPKSKFSFPSEFHLFKFHDFFDGLIGYEFLQKAKAVIDANANILKFPDYKVKLHKKSPGKVKLNACETRVIKIPLDQPDGDFFLEQTNLTPSLSINEGLYKVRDKFAFVAVSCSSDESVPISIPHISAEINNFNFVSESDFIKIDDERIRTLCDKLNTKHLSAKEKRVLFKIISKFPNCFHLKGDKLTFSNAIKHRILTKTNTPVHSKTYRYPQCHNDEVTNQVKELLDNKIIRPSMSAFSAPIWVVPKKSDASGKPKWRLVIDYRKLNLNTVEDVYPMPNITDTLDKLGKAQCFSKIDLASGFHQIEVHEDDIEKTAFRVNNGLYEFLRMPFGLKNSPATFQRVMDNVLREFIDVCCVIYLDDILIFSKSFDEHVVDVQNVLQKLEENNLKIQIEKCDFFTKETDYLGHVITTEGVKPDARKISIIQQWPLPQTETELRSYLGLIGYYRRFIQNYANFMKPLTNQLRDLDKGNHKKNRKISHPPDFVETFEKSKNLLTSSSVLIYPDFTKEFILTTDASDYALGAVLSQGVIGQDKPVAFASRTMNKHEENYSVIQKELLAIVWATHYFRSYLYGRKFKLYTDHQPLTYIFNMRDPSSKLVRWRLLLEEFDYEIIYRKGKQNVVADALSRVKNEDNEQHNMDNESIETIHSANTDDSHFIPMTFNSVNLFPNQIIFSIASEKSEKTESVFKNIRTTISSESFNEDEIAEVLKTYLIDNKSNCIFCPKSLINEIQKAFSKNFSRSKIKVAISSKFLTDLITVDEQNEIISKVHDRAHRGIAENIKTIQQQYFFPKIRNKVTAFVNLCPTCKKAKYDRKPYDIKIFEVPEPGKPLDVVHIDIFIKQPLIFLSAVDRFSRFGVLISIKSKNIFDVRKGLFKLFQLFPHPKNLIMDNESSFVSTEIRGLFERLDINPIYTPVNRSEMNGVVERFHSTIAEIFRCTNEADREQKLTPKNRWLYAVSLYNNSFHSAHHRKPAAVFYALKDDEVRPLDPTLVIENKEKFYDEICLELEKRKKLTQALNRAKEEAPKLQEGEVVYVIRPGIKDKTQNKFVETTVKKDNNKTFIDSKNRKIHKNNMRRVTKNNV